MRIYVDKLAKGLKHPVSRAEIRKYLKVLPREHTSHIRSVRFSNAWRPEDGQLVHGCRITIIHAVDRQLRKKYIGIPSEEKKAEWRSFGGTYREVEGVHYVIWESAEKLKRYIRFVLYHEVGHIVFELEKGKISRFSRAEEKFCDEYAYSYLEKELGS